MEEEEVTRLVALLEKQRLAAKDRADTSTNREWWLGYQAALYWISQEVKGETK